MKNICVLTGSRADYGIIKPVLSKIQKSGKLKLCLIVTGMHLDPQFGLTVKEVENDGFPIRAKVDMMLSSDSPVAMAKSVGLGIIGIAQALEEIRPDLFLIPVDRLECLSGAVAASHMNILIAHMHGGEVSGSIDESIRHAITKFAQIHFVTTKESGVRVVRMGELPSRVYNVGAAGLDSILKERLLTRAELERKLGLELQNKFLLVVFHPVTTEVLDSAMQSKIVLDTVKSLNLQCIVLFPNADAGGRKIIERLGEYEDSGNFKIYKSLPHKLYLSLMKQASVMVGNSSSGIIEAPSFGLPVVNIGCRQQGRERASNVIDVGFNGKKISKAVRKALSDEVFLKAVRKRVTPYGNGTASDKIVEILEKLDLEKILVQKKITY